MILQILAGGLAAVAVTAKLYWNRILQFLRIRKDEPEAKPRPAGTDPPSTAAERSRSGAAAVFGYPSARPRAALTPPCPRPRRTRRRPRRAGLEPGSFRDPESRVFYAGDGGLPRALARRPERLRGARRPPACSTTRASCAPSAPTDTAALAGPARARARRRAQARAHPVRLLPVRVDVLDAQGRRAACSSTCCSPRSSTTWCSRTRPPTTCSSTGRKPVFVDIGSFERIREGEPWVGYRQFCMLYLYPLLLQSVKDVPFQPWLRGSIDGITPGSDARADVLPRPLPQGHVHQRLPARAAREALRRPARPGQGRRSSGSSRRSCSWPTCARCASWSSASSWDPPAGRVDGLRRAQQLHRRRRQAQGRLRARGGELASLESGLGHRRQQRPLLAHRRRGRSDGRRRGRRPGPGGAALPRPARRGQRADPDADHEPGRPLAGPGLARARAQVAARARQAGPGAGARARPPRGHQRERAGQGVRGLARVAGQRARDRVPHARGPDGQEAARAQARGPASRLRARLLRALPRGGVRGRALASASSPARACSTSPGRSGDERPAEAAGAALEPERRQGGRSGPT